MHKARPPARGQAGRGALQSQSGSQALSQGCEGVVYGIASLLSGRAIPADKVKGFAGLSRRCPSSQGLTGCGSCLQVQTWPAAPDQMRVGRENAPKMRAKPFCGRSPEVTESSMVERLCCTPAELTTAGLLRRVRPVFWATSGGAFEGMRPVCALLL